MRLLTNVTDTVCHKDARRRDDSLGVGSNVGGDHDETNGEPDGLTVDQPESDESGPGVLVGEREEGHEGGTKDTNDVTDSHHEQSSVGPSSGDQTSDQERDDLERSTGTVEQSGVEGRVAETLDDGTGKVGQNTVGDRRTKHGDGQEPAAHQPNVRITLLTF